MPLLSMRAVAALALGALGLLATLLTAIFISGAASQRLQGQIGTELAELAHHMAGRLDQGMFERWRDIQVTTALDAMRRPDGSTEERRRILDQLKVTLPDYAWIGFVDPGGVVRAATGGLLTGQDVGARPWFQQALQGPVALDVHEALLLAKLLGGDPRNPLRFVDVAAPVRADDGRLIGVVGAHLYWDWAREVERSLREALPDRGASTEILILSREGTVLLGPAPLQGTRLGLPAPDEGLGAQGWRIETGADGRERFTALARTRGQRDFPGLGWSVLVRQDAAVALSPVAELRRHTLIAGSVLSLIVAALAWLGAGVLARPLGRLQAAAEALGRGERVEPPAGGFREAARVGEALASASHSLHERAERLREAAEALERMNQELEGRVAERTAALAAEMREREAAQGQLAQLQKMESLGQLTAGIAHDFNNLLMAVTSSLELIGRRVGDADPRVTRQISLAMQGAERGAALTARLLAFARKQPLNPRPVGVPTLVQGMADLLSRTLGPQIRIETRFPAGLGPIHADANQIELALLNLAVNARDAMPEGGSLTISAREEAAGTEGDGALKPGDYVVVSVTDTGTGMDAATLARAAEPFFTTKGLGKGTGLGLSMVHGLAGQSGGRLVLASQPGLGTTAELWLPRTKEILSLPQAGPAEPERLGEQPAAQARTVLLVDDDPLVLAGTRDLLEDLGVTVLVADAGPQALQLLRAGAPVDLLITDYAMPGMTGVQLAGEVKRLWPGLPVILATGYAELPEGLDLGLARLTKPYRRGALAEAIGRVLPEVDGREGAKLRA